MIVFKINGTKYQFPTRWEDVTFAQYIALIVLPESLRHQISLFTSIPIETLLKAEIKNLEKIAIALSFINISPKFTEGPSPMMGGYTMPKDVTLESLGQFEALKALASQIPPDLSTPEHQQKLAQLYASAASVYLQKLMDGTFDSDKVEKVKELVMTFPCTEVIQTGAFFLFKPITSLRSTETRFQNIRRRLRKLIQELPAYRKTLDLLQRSSGKAKG